MSAPDSQDRKTGDPFLGRFRYLAALEPGWHHGDGAAISREAIELAKHAIIATTDTLGAPGIFPTVGGGVLLEWASPVDVRSIEVTARLGLGCFDLRTGRDEAVRTLRGVEQFFHVCLAAEHDAAAPHTSSVTDQPLEHR